MRVFQVTKDIEDAENFLDHVSSKTDTDVLCSDPQQLTVKLAEEEVCVIHGSQPYCYNQ